MDALTGRARQEYLRIKINDLRFVKCGNDVIIKTPEPPLRKGANLRVHCVILSGLCGKKFVV